MRLGLLLAILIGCTKQSPAPEPKAPPVEDTRPPPPSDAAPAMAPVDDAPPALVDAGQTTPDAAPHAAVFEEAPGLGACKQDSDCELSSWQSGCCLSSCDGYAINKRDNAARIAKENCPPPNTHVCPPPAPCPVPTRRAVEAKCVKQRCTTRFQKRP